MVSKPKVGRVWDLDEMLSSGKVRSRQGLGEGERAQKKVQVNRVDEQ